MRRTIAISILASCSVALLSLSAQTGSSRVTVPSPTAASLGKFGAVPVGLYTGVPNISIPLFAVTSRTLQLPIALRYNASGNRVEEIGGWIGLGWSLEAGGVITRTVRGKVDESQFGYYRTGNSWYNNDNWPTPLTTTILQNIHDGQVDGDPDQFFFSFAGRSGQFVMGPVDVNGTIEYRTVPAEKLRIAPHFNGYDIDSWVITAEDGTRYSFGPGAKETHWDYTSGNITNNGEQYSSSWYLESIAAPGGDAIYLTYTQYSARHQMGWYTELFAEVQAYNPPSNCPPSQFYYNPQYWVNPAQQLASIQSAAYTVTFVTDPALRADALSYMDNSRQEPLLDHITIATPTGTVLKSFKLKHDYYPGNRLRLLSVTEVGANGDSLPPYSFTYDGQTLPSRFSFAQDHWGYYNGQTLNNSFIPTITHTSCLTTCISTVYPGANRNPDAGFAQAGILTKVTFPTGGYNEFVYEGNDYGLVSMGSGWPVDDSARGANAFSAPYEGLHSTSFEVKAVPGTQTVAVHVALSMYVHTGFSNCGNGDPIHPCPWGEMLGQPTKWFPSGTSGQAPIYNGNQAYNSNVDLALAPGTYTIQTSAAGYNVDISIVATWNDRVLNVKKKGGGLRIAQLRTGDGMGNVDTTKYLYTLESGPDTSSGVMGLEPVYDFNYTGWTCSFYSRSSTSKLPLGSGTTGEIAYREVTVVHGGAGEFGSTRHIFRTIKEWLDGFNNSVWPYAQRTSYAWERGQESSNTEYDAGGHPQHQVLSDYAVEHVNPIDSRHFRAMSIYLYPFGPDVGGIPVVYANGYEVIAGWIYQSSEVTTEYDPSGTNSISATKTFMHGNPNHLQLTEIQETNSDGIQRITRMKYPGDYVISGTPPPGTEAAALKAMQDVSTTGGHMPGVVIERSVSVKNGASDRVVQAEITTFKDFASGQFLPYKRYVLNSSGPLP